MKRFFIVILFLLLSGTYAAAQDNNEEADKDTIKDNILSRISDRRKDFITSGMNLSFNVGVDSGSINLRVFLPFEFKVKNSSFLINPMYIFMKGGSGDYQGGSIKEAHGIGAAVMYNYYFLNPVVHTVAPYMGVGPGYNYIRGELELALPFFSVSRTIYRSALTASLGTGVSVKLTDDVRLKVGLNGVSSFSETGRGRFAYDKTEISLTMGVNFMIR